MTGDEADFIGAMNMCDEISDEAYKKIMCRCEEQEPCEDYVSRADALRVAKNEYLRGWHKALCKALNEKHSIHCEEGNFKIIQEETIIGLGLSMNCALGKDVESYMSVIPSVTPTRKKGKWVDIKKDGNRIYRCRCSECGKNPIEYTYGYEDWWFEELPKFCPDCGTKMENEDI